MAGVAVIKQDLEKETADLWVIEVATGKSTRITSSKTREPVQAPVWSPDGRQIAYVAMRDSYLTGCIRTEFFNFDFWLAFPGCW